MRRSDNSLPLEDVLVLELSRMRPGAVLARQLLDHMIQKSDPGVDLVIAAAIEIDRYSNFGFVRFSFNAGFSHS